VRRNADMSSDGFASEGIHCAQRQLDLPEVSLLSQLRQHSEGEVNTLLEN
jgi:hypothetical protein